MQYATIAEALQAAEERAEQARRRRNTPLPYKARIVAFIDLYGFRPHIAEATARFRKGDPTALQKLRQLRDALRSHAASFSGDRTEESWRITMFSDCIVIFVAHDQASAVFHTLLRLTWLIGDVLDAGFLVRGGVSVGLMHHTRDFIFGEALIKAYELESKHAHVPRVLVDPELVGIAGRHRADHHSPADEIGYVASFLAKDRDGRLYLDVLKAVEQEMDPEEAYAAMLWRVRAAIEQMRAKARTSKHRERAGWLVRYFNRNLRRFKDEFARPLRIRLHPGKPTKRPARRRVRPKR